MPEENIVRVHQIEVREPVVEGQANHVASGLHNAESAGSQHCPYLVLRDQAAYDVDSAASEAAKAARELLGKFPASHPAAEAAEAPERACQRKRQFREAASGDEL